MQWLPGSHTSELVENGRYRQLEGDYEIEQRYAIEPLPSWLRDLAESKAEPLTTGLSAIELDQPHHIENAINFLSYADPAVEGRGGDGHTWQVAVGCRR